MSRYRPYIVLCSVIVLALVTYGEMFGWFSAGALYNQLFPCVQDPYTSAPCYLGVDILANLLLLVSLVALVVWYIASLICREKGSEACAALRAQRRAEIRILGIICAAFFAFVLTGSIVTKLTVHDNLAASATQRQCGHTYAYSLTHEPLMHFLVVLGKVSVSPGDTPFDARIQPYTIWHIPLNALIDPQNYPNVSMSVMCNFDDTLPVMPALPAEHVPEGWTPDELARYQERLRNQLTEAEHLLASSTPRAAEVSTWKTYHSKECGFSFSYPATYFVNEYATATPNGMSCSDVLMYDTQFSHDYLAGTLEADGVPQITLRWEEVPVASSTEGIVARAERARFVTDSSLPPNPYTVITFAAETAILTSWESILNVDTISFYRGTKRYDLSTATLPEDMRKDFYAILSTLVVPDAI